MELSFELLSLLLLAGLVAGLIDTLAGGGGLITIPALMMTGMPIISAIATNKFQASFGTFTASLIMIKKNLIDIYEIKGVFIAAMIGSIIGAIFIHYIDEKTLSFVIPLTLLLIAIYFIFMPYFQKKAILISSSIYRTVIIPAIGFYDGAFGPGTGSFFTLSGLAFRGHDIKYATARAKILNFATNVSSLAVFIFSGHIIWLAGAAMLLGQIIGAYISSHFIIKGKTKIIRPLVIIVCFAMLSKYGYDNW